MLVNKPGPGTREPPRRKPAKARPHPEPGRGNLLAEVCVGGRWFREGSQVHCPFLAPSKWGGGGAMRGPSGVLPPPPLHQAQVRGLGP